MELGVGASSDGRGEANTFWALISHPRMKTKYGKPAGCKQGFIVTSFRAIMGYVNVTKKFHT